jgi:predicted DNA-binding ribbon-helix-helix protein
MTLGNVRELGVPHLIAFCLNDALASRCEYLKYALIRSSLVAVAGNPSPRSRRLVARSDLAAGRGCPMASCASQIQSRRCLTVPKQTSVMRRAIRISGRHTGVSLEDQFWSALGEIAFVSGTTRPALIAKIEKGRTGANLSSAVRVFVLAHYRGGRMSGESRPSSIIKKSMTIAGHPTSISLEPEFWNALKKVATAKQVSITQLVAKIDKERRYGNLSSAIRVFVLAHHRAC